MAAVAPPVVAVWQHLVPDHPAVAGALILGYESLLAVGRSVGDGLMGRWRDRFVNWADRELGIRLSRFGHRYRDFVSTGLRYIDLKGLATVGFYTPELDEVFVDLSITPSPPHDVPLSVLPDAPIGDVTRLTLSDYLDRPQPSVIAIIGGPGVGKTTLLLQSARQICRTTRGRRRTVPILLYLRDHVATIMSDPQVMLPNVVRDTLGRHRATEPQGWFERHLAEGDCVVFLDGLDEVAGQADRRTLADWVERQVEQYPKNDYVITSRPHGYRTARIKGATVMRMLRMTNEQVTLFVKRWYHAFELAVERYNRRPVGKNYSATDSAAERAEHAAKDMLERLPEAPALYDMTANPMLLTMIMNVHRFRSALPGSRVDLYDEICQVMLGRRQEAKKIPISLGVGKKEAVLRRLAYTMMRKHVRDLDRADVLRTIEPALRRVSPELTTKDFLDDVDTNGFLVERENGLYAFAHHTFQEYLAAAHIREKGLARVLTQVVDDVWWRETTLLYAARSDADPIIAACLESDSVTALSLAFDCEAQRSEIAPELRERLKQLLNSALAPETSPQRRRLMAGVMVARHLRRLTMPAGTSRICAEPITTKLYRLHLMDTENQPWDEPWLLEPGDEQPILGVYGREAAAFARWINMITGGEAACRLPTRAELDDPVVLRAINASTPGAAGNVNIWVHPGQQGGDPELWTSTGGVHPYTIDGEVLAAHITDDINHLFPMLARLLLLQSVTMLPALVRAHAVAVANATSPGSALPTELTRALELVGALDSAFDLSRTLDLVRQLNTSSPHARGRSGRSVRGNDPDILRVIATGRTILPISDSQSTHPQTDSHADDTVFAGDNAQRIALTRALIHDLTEKLGAAHDLVDLSTPAYVLAIDGALSKGMELARALDELLRNAEVREETMIRHIDGQPVLARVKSPDHGLALFVGNLLSGTLWGTLRHIGPSQARERPTFQAEISEFIIREAKVLPTHDIVSPDTLADVLNRALDLLRERTDTLKEGSAPIWVVAEVGDRLREIALPIFTWQRILTPADATAIRLAALCLAVEADVNGEAHLANLFRKIVAGVTLLERRTDGRAPLTEAIVLTII